MGTSARIMKLVGTFSLFGAACALSAAHDAEWLAWKHQNKVSFTQTEEISRYATFQKARHFVSLHNERAAKGQETYTVGLNKFAAMDQAEFGEKYLSHEYEYGEKSLVMEYQCPEVFASSGAATPSEISYVAGQSTDVRVTTIKDQGSCGSCWSFGAGAAIEAAVCGAGGEDCTSWQGVSTQQLVDCASYTPQTSQTNPLVIDLNPYDNHGCGGGFPFNAIRYVVLNGGIDNWVDYPYVSGTTQTEGDCAYDASSALVNPVSSCGSAASGDEAQLAEAVSQKGPHAIGIDASGLGFQLYSGGVYNSNTCSSTRLNHAVAAVGFGSQSGAEYWQVKNSWGAAWGDSGYILIARNTGNMCGVATDTCYAIA